MRDFDANIGSVILLLDRLISDRLSIGKTLRKKGRWHDCGSKLENESSFGSGLCLATALASQSFPQIKRILFAPHPYLVPMSRLTGAALEIGGQDCHFADHGAFTGDVSAPCCVIVEHHRCC